MFFFYKQMYLLVVLVEYVIFVNEFDCVVITIATRIKLRIKTSTFLLFIGSCSTTFHSSSAAIANDCFYFVFVDISSSQESNAYSKKLKHWSFNTNVLGHVCVSVFYLLAPRNNSVKGIYPLVTKKMHLDNNKIERKKEKWKGKWNIIRNKRQVIEQHALGIAFCKCHTLYTIPICIVHTRLWLGCIWLPSLLVIHKIRASFDDVIRAKHWRFVLRSKFIIGIQNETCQLAFCVCIRRALCVYSGQSSKLKRSHGRMHTLLISIANLNIIYINV